MALSFSLALTLCMPSFCNQTQNSLNIDFGPIVPSGTYVSSATSFGLHTQTICINICICHKYSTLLFAGSILKQANSASVCRESCPLSVIEDDEVAAHVYGYCSWTTYELK